MNKELAEKTLSGLHKKIIEAIEASNEFIEENKHLFAEFQIGQKVLNKESGIEGVVAGHYHFANGYPDCQDFYESFNIHCTIDYISELGVNRQTNTSRHGRSHPWIAVD